LCGESSGIVQYHLSGTEGRALELSQLKILINCARRWATRRGATVLHLGGGVGSAQDSLMHFKPGFSDRRHFFKTWHVALDEQRYADLGATAEIDRLRSCLPRAYFVSVGRDGNLLQGVRVRSGATVGRGQGRVAGRRTADHFRGVPAYMIPTDSCPSKRREFSTTRNTGSGRGFHEREIVDLAKD
jgi:hypothetical protein